MSTSDYIGVILALSIGIACITYRKRMAIIAVRRHERVFGAHYDQRAFEFGFSAAGIAFIAWSLFVTVGAVMFAH